MFGLDASSLSGFPGLLHDLVGPLVEFHSLGRSLPIGIERHVLHEKRISFRAGNLRRIGRGWNAQIAAARDGRAQIVRVNALEITDEFERIDADALEILSERFAGNIDILDRAVRRRRLDKLAELIGHALAQLRRASLGGDLANLRNSALSGFRALAFLDERAAGDAHINRSRRHFCETFGNDLVPVDFLPGRDASRVFPERAVDRLLQALPERLDKRIAREALASETERQAVECGNHRAANDAAFVRLFQQRRIG